MSARAVCACAGARAPVSLSFTATHASPAFTRALLSSAGRFGPLRTSRPRVCVSSAGKPRRASSALALRASMLLVTSTSRAGCRQQASACAARQRRRRRLPKTRAPVRAACGSRACRRRPRQHQARRAVGTRRGAARWPGRVVGEEGQRDGASSPRLARRRRCGAAACWRSRHAPSAPGCEQPALRHARRRMTLALAAGLPQRGAVGGGGARVRLRPAAAEHQDARTRQAHGGCGCESPCALPRRAALLLRAHAAPQGETSSTRPSSTSARTCCFANTTSKARSATQPAQPAPARD